MLTVCVWYTRIFLCQTLYWTLLLLTGKVIMQKSSFSFAFMLPNLFHQAVLWFLLSWRKHYEISLNQNILNTLNQMFKKNRFSHLLNNLTNYHFVCKSHSDFNSDTIISVKSLYNYQNLFSQVLAAQRTQSPS